MTEEDKEEWAAIRRELQTLADGHPTFHVRYRLRRAHSASGAELYCEVFITKKGPSAGESCEEAGH